MLASIRFLLVAALVSTTVGSAVVPSASAAAPSDAGGKKRYETSTAESGGSNQIFVGSDDITTDLRPTDGTNVGLPSKAVTEYLPPGTVFEELLKKGADGIPKKDESDEIFPAAMSDENIVGTTVSPSVKDTGMTIVTEERCYDWTNEANIWTLGGGSTIGTDTTKNTNRNAVADVTSFDGTTNDVVKKEEEEEEYDAVGPIVDPVGPTPVLSDDGNTNPGPADPVKTIVTADHTMIDTTDAMAVIAGLPIDDGDADDVTITSTLTVSPTTNTTKKKKKREKNPIFPSKPTFPDDIHIIDKFLLSIPYYLPDPFELIARAVEGVYTAVTTNSVGDVVSKATRVISEGITKIASGVNDAATVVLDTIDELVGKLMEAIDSIDESDVKKISQGLTIGAAFVFIVLSGVTFEYFLFRN